MLHPLFSTLIQRPDLLVEHVSAYSALFHQEATQAGSLLVKRYLAWATAAIFGLVFVLFAGIALMLGTLQNQFHWVLLAVPGSALVLMLLAIAKAKVPLAEARFTELKAQIDSDIQALRAVS
jgi:hypothetical protein